MALDPKNFVLARDEVHVWHASLAANSDERAVFFAMLSTDERERAQRLKKPELGERFVVGRGMLRCLLSGYVGEKPEALRFSYGEQGKPALVSRAVEFNVSHSEDRVVFAVTRVGPVGIDLEEMRALDFEGVARAGLGEEAVAALRVAQPEHKQELFFTLWARHEARVKAGARGMAGMGLMMPVYDLGIMTGFKGAVAVGREGVRIVVREVKGLAL